MDLQAVTNKQHQCSAISSQEQLSACKQGSVAYVVQLNVVSESDASYDAMPVEILRLLEHYTDVFEEPKGFAHKACF